MKALFLSDVHVSAERRAAVESLLDLLGGPALHCQRLFILGDLFDQWLGDDDTQDPHPEVESALHRLAASGVSVDVMHGNHDFLIGREFCRRTGARLLGDPTKIELDGIEMVVCHGDALCTDDLDYQAFRRWTRDPGAQRDYLARPLAERGAIWEENRERSAAASALKPESIMDVNHEACCAVLRDHSVRRLVHGHTHRPAEHEFDLDGAPAWRTVLGDWYRPPRVGVWRDGALSLVGVDDAGRRLAG